MIDHNEDTTKRKMEHIEICLNEQVNGERVTTGLERYRFRHLALPELDFAEIHTDTSFLGKSLRAPFLISSMTGGTEKAWTINRRLAAAAEKRGWALGVGSVRAAIEDKRLAYTFNVREFAPTIPIIANIGAVQLNYGYGAEECRQAVELVQADALVLHLNALQEVFQPEGNTNFKNLLRAIERVCRSLDVPVGVKEVGWGISGDLAAQLQSIGVHFIDVAGAGGTSWSQVEKYRSKSDVHRQAAEAFADWGLPTADAILEVKAEAGRCVIIGSGGITTGVEAAKAFVLGADLAGFGRTLLASAMDGEELAERVMAQKELELRAAMFSIGAADLSALRSTKRLLKE